MTALHIKKTESGNNCLSEDLAGNFSEFLFWAVSIKVPRAYDN
jgi:hypothetical protein